MDNTQDPATTESGTSLLILPAELHLAIAQNLDWWDIYALRFTCRLMNSLLPHLKVHGDLPSLELSFEIRNSYTIPMSRFKELCQSASFPAVYPWCQLSRTTAQLRDSFYMANQGYYICFGCGSIKDDGEWYEWRRNEMRRVEPRGSHGKGMPWRVWQRCKSCDEELQKRIVQRCPQHEKTRPHHVCRSCGPSMLRIGLTRGPRKKQVQKRPLNWL